MQTDIVAVLKRKLYVFRYKVLCRREGNNSVQFFKIDGLSEYLLYLTPQAKAIIISSFQSYNSNKNFCVQIIQHHIRHISIDPPHSLKNAQVHSDGYMQGSQSYSFRNSCCIFYQDFLIWHMDILHSRNKILIEILLINHS
ncbi:hypothetical protein FHS86_000852 [Roseimarinus sediminis]